MAPQSAAAPVAGEELFVPDDPASDEEEDEDEDEDASDDDSDRLPASARASPRSRRSPASPALSAPPSPDPFDPAPALLVAARSFLAQPLPLNTIAGAAKAFLRVPSAPHSGQNCGTGSWMPWRMSVLRPQAEQRYS